MATKRSPDASTSAISKASKPRRGKSEAATPASGTSKDARKLVRDSFTMPKSEYMAIEALKTRASGLGRHAKKSELLRAGLHVLNSMSDRSLTNALNAVPTLKTGRPKGEAADATKVSATASAKRIAKTGAGSARKQVAAGRRSKRSARAGALSSDAAS
jgi:hypothetical protein